MDSNGLVKSADIKAFITKDDFGELISGVTISVDQIQLEGLVTANGNFKILEDGSMEAVNGTFKGHVEAESGRIGNFIIEGGNITTGTDGRLFIGEQQFQNRLGTLITTKRVSVQGGISSSIVAEYDFTFRENNRLTLRDTTGKPYNWLNIAVGNVMDVDYSSGTSSSTASVSTYGCQFAMLGTGHVVQDGMVEGACLDLASG